MFLSAEDILKQTELPHVDVEVPEWGGTVRIRSLNGRERDEMEAAVIVYDEHGREGRDLTNIRSKLIAKCVINPDTGERMFTDAQAHALGELSAAALERLFDAINSISGMGDGAVEEAVANFGDAPSGRSTSASPSRSAAQSANSSPDAPAES